VAGRSGGERQQHGAPQATYPLQHDISSLRDPHAQVLGSPRGRRVSNGRRGGGIPRAPVSSAAVGGASGLAPAAEEADDNNLATLACEGGGGRPGVGLCSYPRRPAALSRIRGRGLGEARPLAASGPALPSRWPMAETGADCPALSAQPNDDLLSDLFHFPDATPPSKRRRVTDQDVVDLTDDSPVLVNTPERPSTGGSEVEVVGFRPPPTDEVQVVDSREPIDSLWHSLTTTAVRADHSSRAYRRRPIRLGSRRSGPSDYGPAGSGVAPPDSALRCGAPSCPPSRWDSNDARRKHGGAGLGTATEDGADRESRELAELLVQEEERFAALSALRHDGDLDARLEELHAQEAQAQQGRWTQNMQNYARSRIAQTLYRHASNPSREQLRDQLRESMMGHSAARHAHLAGSGYAWNRGHQSSAALASPGFGDLLFGGAFPPMQQLQYLSHQVQAIRQVREGRLPTHMLLSDRDFDENDYEALLALDEGVENRKGAAEGVINQLPTETVVPSPSKAAACTPQRCMVCLEEPQAGEVLRSLPCHHKYHKHCIDKWLVIKATCPICQRDVK